MVDPSNFRRLVRASLPLLVVNVVMSCASRREILFPIQISDTPIAAASIEKALEPLSVEEATRDARRAFAVAESLRAQGRHEEALEHLNDGVAISQIPKSLRSELLSLRRRIRRLHFQETVLKGSVRATDSRIELGQSLRLEWSVGNRSDQPLVLPATGGKRGFFSRSASKTMVSLNITYVEVDVLGSRLVTQWKHSLELGEEVRLEPGERAVRKIEIPTDDDRFHPDRLVYRRVTVSLGLPASLIRQGDQETFLELELGSVDVEVFPKGFQRIDRDADRLLTDALGTKKSHPQAPTIVLMAASLLAHRDREGCRNLLRAALTQDLQPSLLRAVKAAQSIVDQPPS